MTPFYGRGSTSSRLEPLQGDSLLFTTKFPEIPGTTENVVIFLRTDIFYRTPLVAASGLESNICNANLN